MSSSRKAPYPQEYSTSNKLGVLVVLFRFPWPPAFLATLVTMFLTAAYNHSLFSKLNERLAVFSWDGAGFVTTLFALMLMLLSVPVLLFVPRFLLKAALIALVMLSAGLSYFTQNLGIVFDMDMVRNLVETVRDQNQQEARELLSLPLILHLVLWGVLPSIIIALIPLQAAQKWWKSLGIRLIYTLILISIAVSLFVVNNKYATFFARENGDLKAYITPLFALNSTYRYFNTFYAQQEQPFTILGNDAHQQKPTPRRTIGIMVVGETARADHFSLNGYAQPTNPLLSKENLISFQAVSSCGTSTAYSVPCMFSFLGQKDYSPETADKQSNSLDVLQKAGVKVVWIDNNSSCKGVCTRIENRNLLQQVNHSDDLYSDNGYYDEVMLNDLEHYLAGNQDVLIVLHTLGSHGPTYHKRYPAAFAQFQPYCKQDTPHACPQAEVINAYDNTILYTDYVLSKTIQWLKTQSQQADTFLLYASDHGESLGENGIYLHGLPYFLAPEAQTHIPMLLWLSESYRQQYPQAWSTLQAKINAPLSHDNLSHSLLGLYAVQSHVYQSNLDLLR